MSETLRVSMVQMTSHNTYAQNVKTLRAAAQKASDEDAEMLALPEAAGLMDRDKVHARAQITTEDADPYIAGCREVAAKHSIWVHSGSSPVKSNDGRYLNHTVLIAPTGEIVARYDKVHLFDVAVILGQWELAIVDAGNQSLPPCQEVLECPCGHLLFL